MGAGRMLGQVWSPSNTCSRPNLPSSQRPAWRPRVFGNYFAPIFQGSPEVVYPRVNNLSILILFLSYLLDILSFVSEFGGGTGWTLYPPLSTSFMSLSPSATAYLVFGLLMSGISSCLTSINFFVTILNLRSYCLTLKTMPLFPC